METHWDIMPKTPEDIFEKLNALPKLVSTLLYNRNIKTTKEADEFLNPVYSKNVHDPFLFQDMQKAVDRIFIAIEKKENIIIYGDYDADGISSAILLDSIIEKLGGGVSVFLPHRQNDGYGLNIKNIEQFAKDEVNLIITCDCGISNRNEVKKAKKLGIDTIITDHHTVPDILPDAVAVIHPGIKNTTYPDNTLAGAGVAFKLLQGLLKHHKKTNEVLPDGEKHEAFEKWSLDMVAIATVADMVPLKGESRTLTKYGLLVLNKTRRAGLQKLYVEARIAEVDGKLKKRITEETIGFYIAPRINAAGRISHPKIAFDLLKTKSKTNAVDLAYLLDTHNKNRRQETEIILKDALHIVEKEQYDKEVLCVIGKNWSSGLVGLVASKLKEKYNRPALVVSHTQSLVGSGRSITGFNMIEAMQKMPEFFVKFGGHPMACGFTLKHIDIVEDFQNSLIKYFLETGDKDRRKVIKIDTEVDLEKLDWDMYNYVQRFEPFGKDNEKPKYLANELTITHIQQMGKGGKHVRLMVKHRSQRIFKVVGWNLCGRKEKDWCQILRIGDKIDIVFELGINEWNGTTELQRTIIDIRKTT
ncbi:MAG: single-stranded-DNA-specific exonuclease RecJ [Candidatus Magasanikbacteria bacterium]|nr:single-stranded-DNA-specific exonuclease RecJ [Candidatus Magasanikbacteria bacterium]